MCLIVFAANCHPDYPLVVAANRDEFYQRPTSGAHFWPDHPQLLAGRDEELSGTWLGVTRNGRFAAVTNYREGQQPPAPRSRGELVTAFLTGTASANDYANTLKADEQQYNGYNLILFDGDQLVSCSNRFDAVQTLSPGLYGLSNHLLETPWPKVQTAKANLRSTLNQSQITTEALLDTLTRRTPYPPQELPDTGIDAEWEQALSPPFVITDHYGTRCSTAVLFDRWGKVEFVEQSFSAQGEATDRAAMTFAID